MQHKKKINQETLRDINRIVYSGPAGTVSSIPFWRVYDGSASGQLKGKIVFIGVTAPDLHDDKPVPFSNGQAMAGVEIHANIANMLLLDYRSENFHRGLMSAWLALAVLVPFLTFLLFNNVLWPVAGLHTPTAGHTAAVITLLLGYAPVILMGLPADDSGHFYPDAPINPDGLEQLDYGERRGKYQDAWLWLRDNFFEGRVKSVSGNTREWLDAP